jgi:class 3 adenylate cyclase
MAPQRRTVCVLFSDIRGFSRRCESESPEAIVVLLNRYFNEMTAVVHNYGGSIDKFIGDGLMGLFGVSKSDSSSVNNAFTAAREMIGRLQILNEELQKSGVERIEIGIGIHVGEVVIGHVGSDFRNEYTVIGDTVNLAARLEGKAKETGYPVICSSAVAERLTSSSLLHSLGKTEIKGMSDVEIFAWEPAQRVRRISG